MMQQTFKSVSIDAIPADRVLHRVSTPQAWYGPELARRPEEWTHVFSADESAELLAAIAAVEARGLDVTTSGLKHFRCRGWAARCVVSARTCCKDGGSACWLSCDDGPALPAVFDNYTGLDARGRPMGLYLDGGRLTAPLLPEDGGPGSSEQRLAVSDAGHTS